MNIVGSDAQYYVGSDILDVIRKGLSDGSSNITVYIELQIVKYSQFRHVDM